MGEYVLTTAKRRRLAHIPSERFDHRTSCRRVVEHWRVRFDHRKALRSYEECALTTARHVGGSLSFGRG